MRDGSSLSTVRDLGSRDRTALVAAGFAIFLLVGALQALYGPSLPSVRSAFGLSAATSGWVIGAHYLGAVSGVLLSIPLETRLSVRVRIVIGVALMAAGALLFGTIPLWPLVLAGPLGMGLGYGFVTVVINVLFASRFGDGNPAMLILVNACFGLGAVIGPFLYGLLSSGQFRPAFLAVAVTGVLLLLPAWRVRGSDESREDVVVPSGGRFPPALLAFVALFLLYTGLESDTSGWMATHLIHHGYSQAAAAGLTSAFWVAFTVGRVLSVPVSARLTPARLIVGVLIGVILLAAAARLDVVLPVIYILIGLLFAPIFPVGFAWMDTGLRGVQGMASMALLGALAGGLIFPVLVGTVIGATSADALPLALMALALAAIGVVMSITRLAGSGGAGQARRGKMRYGRRGFG